MSGLHIRRGWRRVLPVPCLLSDNLKFQLSSITILMFCLHNYPRLFIIKYGKTPPFRHLEEFIRNVFIKTCQQRESQFINLYLPAVRGGSPGHAGQENVAQRARRDISHEVHCHLLSPRVIGKGQPSTPVNTHTALLFNVDPPDWGGVVPAGLFTECSRQGKFLSSRVIILT